MKENTLLETLRALLGVPLCAIPLSVCKPSKAYLLERDGIPPTGTAIIFAIPYLMTGDVDDPARNVSLYAVPRDYHVYMEELADEALPCLQDLYPSNRFALYADHSPIAEVDAAARGGLGVLGMNGLLLTEEYGSFVFLGEIITDADYTAVTGESAPSFPADPPTCEACGACLRACPGHCTGGERETCLSAITQKKGELTADEAAAVRDGGLIWGCDTCQLVCPRNRRVLEMRIDTPIPFFRESRICRLDSHILDGMTQAEFQARAYSWRGRGVIERNVALLESCANESAREHEQERSPS